jgi:hypothetical protein
MNYNFFQRVLHNVVLNNTIVKEASFSLEKSMTNVDMVRDCSAHVFVTGMARSGTTILLQALHDTGKFASLTYADMPFVLSPNLWSKFNHNNQHEKSQERAHGDGIIVDTNSPEAFEEIFWTTYDQEKAEKNFSLFVQLVLTRYKKNRYLSKNNQNIHRVRNIARLFPSAQILIPYRTPLQHAYSILKQHIRFCHLQKNDNFTRDYMYWTAHSEFGLDYVPLKPSKIYHDYHSLNHWLEQWELVYEDLINNYSNLENVKFINYERLCGSPLYLERLAKFVGISASELPTFVMSKAKVTEDYDHSLLSRALSIYKEISKSNT